MTVDINKLIVLVLKEADELAECAAYQGSFSDNGAGRLREQVRFYQMGGGKGTIPSEWQKYVKMLDPEYQEYLRLKGKFG